MKVIVVALTIVVATSARIYEDIVCVNYSLSHLIQ